MSDETSIGWSQSGLTQDDGSALWKPPHYGRYDTPENIKRRREEAGSWIRCGYIEVDGGYEWREAWLEGSTFGAFNRLLWPHIMREHVTSAWWDPYANRYGWTCFKCGTNDSDLDTLESAKHAATAFHAQVSL